MEKSASWVSKLWSSSRSSRRGGAPKSFDPSTTGASSGNPYKEVGGRRDGQGLPQVPRGALTGLRSFVRNVGRSRQVPATTQRSSTTAVGSPDDVMLTMMSAEYDYHGHIRNSASVVAKSASISKNSGQPEAVTRSIQDPEQIPPHGQAHTLGHFRETFQGPVPDDLHNQFVEEYGAHDYLGQLRKTSTIGQAR